MKSRTNNIFPLHILLWKLRLSHLHSACQTVHCFVIPHHRVSLGKVTSSSIITFTSIIMKSLLCCTFTELKNVIICSWQKIITDTFINATIFSVCNQKASFRILFSNEKRGSSDVQDLMFPVVAVRVLKLRFNGVFAQCFTVKHKDRNS